MDFHFFSCTGCDTYHLITTWTSTPDRGVQKAWRPSYGRISISYKVSTTVKVESFLLLKNSDLSLFKYKALLRASLACLV